MKHSITILLGLIASVASAELKEGTFTLSIKQGELEQTLLYTRKGEQLRLEYPGKHIPAKPYNLINTNSGEVIIARPLNSTWTLVPAERLAIRKASPFPEPPAPSAGIGANPGPAGVPGRVPVPATPPQPETYQAPESTPANLPANPNMPTPTLPDGAPLPKGIGPQPEGENPQTIPGGMPMMPGQEEEMQLTKGKESKKINGYQCQKYLMALPGEGVLTLWLSEVQDLPPFYLPLQAEPRNRGRTDWREQWPTVLREKKLFPMLAILRTATEKAKESTDSKKADPIKQGREIARWSVLEITPKPITDTENTLFSVPKNYHQLESSNF